MIESAGRLTPLLGGDEDAVRGLAARLVDDIDAAVVLGERELLPLDRICEGPELGAELRREAGLELDQGQRLSLLAPWIDEERHPTFTSDAPSHLIIYGRAARRRAPG